MKLQTAMILAAGHGERMRPLTEHTPKPLLRVNDKPLIGYTLERLAAAGFNHIVINTGRLGQQFEQQLGKDAGLGVQLDYVHEGESPLETAGGIINALSRLSGGPFAVINGDVWCDYPLERLPGEPDGLAHLVMVNNPGEHPNGDFSLHQGRISLSRGMRLTFSGIAVYRRELFDEFNTEVLPLAPILRHAITKELVCGEHYLGEWFDIGTPQRLAALQSRLAD